MALAISEGGDIWTVALVILGVGWQARTTTKLLVQYRQSGELPPTGVVEGSHLTIGSYMAAAQNGLNASWWSLCGNVSMVGDMFIHPITNSAMFDGTGVAVSGATLHGSAPFSGIWKDDPEISDHSLGATMDGECAPHSARGLHRAHHQTYNSMGIPSDLLHANKLGQVIDDWSFQAEVTAALLLVSGMEAWGFPIHMSMMQTGVKVCRDFPNDRKRSWSVDKKSFTEGPSATRDWLHSLTVLKVKRPEPYLSLRGMFSTLKANDNVSCLVHTYQEEGHIWIAHAERPWEATHWFTSNGAICRLKPQ